jgi:hypothetical protein
MPGRTALDIVAGGECSNALIRAEYQIDPPPAGGRIHTRSVYL